MEKTNFQSTRGEKIEFYGRVFMVPLKTTQQQTHKHTTRRSVTIFVQVLEQKKRTGVYTQLSVAMR